MELRDIAEKIGYDTYPQSFEEIYTQKLYGTEPACDLGEIDRLQQEYQVFGKYSALVRETAQKINDDDVYSTFVKVMTVFLSDEKWGSCREIPVPKPCGQPKRDLLTLFAMIPLIPKAIKSYRSHGFCEEEIQQYMAAFKTDIEVVEKRTGYPGLDKLYFCWSYLFATAKIFKVYGIQFERCRLRKDMFYLRNRESDDVLPVAAGGIYHASGVQKLGAKGYEDDGGSFEVTFEEDAENYYGHGVYDAVVSKEKQVFSKSRWECIAEPGAKGLAMHLPRGSDIRKDNVMKACETAKEIITKEYPEYKNAQIQCTSWLLDPTLEKLMGEESNIVKFGKLFARYPVKGNGQAVFGFVFPANYESYEALPENTRLEKALKELYLDGGHIYLYSGIMR